MANEQAKQWYREGTVNVTQNSSTITGVNTNWINAGISSGDLFFVGTTGPFEISSVNSATSITLREAYSGSTLAGTGYSIIQRFMNVLNSELAARQSLLVNKYETYIDSDLQKITGPAARYSDLYKGTWTSGKAYQAMDTVGYNGVLYSAIQAHTASATNGPTGSSPLWVTAGNAIQTDIFAYNNAGVRNANYRGKNLGNALTAAQSAEIRAGTFKDLYVGDYWQIPVTYNYYWATSDTTAQSGKTYYADVHGTALETQPEAGTDISGAGYYELFSDSQTINFQIADFDYFLNCGNPPTNEHHVVVIPDKSLYTHVMNPTNTTEGGYVGSKMYTEGLERAKAIFKAAFGEEHLLSHREYLTNAVTEGKPSGGSWRDSLVELMSEQMVYGSRIFGAGNNGETPIPSLLTIANSQLNLFRNHKELVKNRQFTWLRNVVNNFSFAMAYLDGNSYCRLASEFSGIRPYALIY